MTARLPVVVVSRETKDATKKAYWAVQKRQIDLQKQSDHRAQLELALVQVGACVRARPSDSSITRERDQLSRPQAGQLAAVWPHRDPKLESGGLGCPVGCGRWFFEGRGSIVVLFIRRRGRGMMPRGRCSRDVVRVCPARTRRWWWVSSARPSLTLSCHMTDDPSVARPVRAVLARVGGVSGNECVREADRVASFPLERLVWWRRTGGRELVRERCARCSDS